MSTRIKFFRERDQVHNTHQFLNTRGIKSYIRERAPSTTAQGEEPYGFDLYALRDEDVDEARQIIAFEFGSGWGENPT